MNKLERIQNNKALRMDENVNTIYDYAVNGKAMTLYIDEITYKIAPPNDDDDLWGNFNIDYIRERIEGENLTAEKEIKELIRNELDEWVSMD